MLPRITLVTPSLNQGNFIAETIESVAAQRYPNLEYFIRDGGSTDGTSEVVRQYSSVVTDYVSEPDNGQADALNKGFAQASGEILAWLNADDLLEPHALTTVAELYRRERFAFVHGDGWKLISGRSRRKRVRTGITTPERLRIRDTILQPSAFWSRDAMTNVGQLDASLQYVFDWDFFIRISRVFPLHHAAVPLSTYRIHPGHKTATGGKRRAHEIMEVIHRYASPEWQAAFDDLWERYDRMQAGHKILRLMRAMLVAAYDPGLLYRHGPRRLGVAALTLL